MNRISIVVGLLWLSVTANFAQLRVVQLDALGVQGVRPSLSSDGSRLAYVSDSSELCVVDLASAKQWVVVRGEDIGSDVVFSDNGEMVAYSSQVYKDRLSYNSIYATDLQTGRRYSVSSPARVRYAYRFSGGWLRIGKTETIRRVKLLPHVERAKRELLLAVEEDDLVLYDGVSRRVLNPNGKNTYLWARLSPDESKIVYMAIEDKCHTYVCDLNGKNVVDLGHYIASPCWAGNDLIVGQQDEDDGHQMTGSRLVAIRADGSGFQILQTPGYERAVNPTAAGSTVVFENDGQLVKLRLEF